MKDDNQKMSTRISCLLEPSTLSKADFLRFYEKQRENGDWTFYEEREFMENLFCTRLNYFFIIFSLSENIS